MKIYLTLDYEIYFGEPTGSARKCMIDPTNKLMDITERTGVPMTYFIDIGYLIQLEKFKGEFRKLYIDFELMKNQIRRLVEQGNDCQLHIHPHWEDSYFDGKKWNIDVSRYKLADFEEKYIFDLVARYKERLERITGQPVTSYRAGGWCLQPFKKIRKAFESHGLKLDSTVFPGGYKSNDVYHYDFREVPNKTRWQFYKKLTVEDPEGPFTELPIASYVYHPVFFWKLFILGRLRPSQHKPIGDGKPINSDDGGKKTLLTRSNLLPVSLDGYFVTKISSALNQAEKKGNGEDFVVIGHPKAVTNYSLKALEKFIVEQKKKHQFLTFKEV